MAEIKIDLQDFDLEELFEQGHDNMSDALTGTIVSQITSRVEHRIKAEVGKRVDERVRGIIDNAILEKTRVVLKDFLSQPVNRTDRYGDTTAHFDSVYDMIKSEFDDLTNMPVNSKGEFLSKDKCSYGKSHTHLQYLIKKTVEESARKLGRRVLSTVDQQIKDAMTKEVEAALAKKITEKLLEEK